MEKHYYLINGKIMKGGEMPNVMYNHPNYNDIMMTWKNSLQPCEIDESELENVKNNVYTFYNCKADDPIEITDIVRVKEIRTETKSGGWTDYKIYFKQPKAKEDSEAVWDEFTRLFCNAIGYKTESVLLPSIEYLKSKYTITRNI